MEGPYAVTAAVHFSKRCTKGSAYHSTRNAPSTKTIATSAVSPPYIKSATKNTTQLTPTARNSDPTMVSALASCSLWDLACWRHSNRCWEVGAMKKMVAKAVDNSAVK